MTTFDPSRTSANITLSGGNLIATQSGAGANLQSFGTTSKASSKWYFSATPGTIGAAGVEVGLANSSASFNLGQYLGWPGSNSFGWISSSGNILLNDSVIATIATYSAGNVVWLAVDLTGKLFWGRVGAGNWNNSGTANPDTGAGGVDISGMASFTLFAGINTGTLNDAVTIDFSTTTGLSNFTVWDGNPVVHWGFESDDRNSREERFVSWRRAVNDPDVYRPFIHPPWRPYVFDDQDNPLQRGSRHIIFRRHHNDPDLVGPPIHKPWAPYVFDDQDNPPSRQRAPYVFRRRYNDQEIAGPQPQWVCWGYDRDDPPIPRAQLYRRRHNDPDLVAPFVHPPWPAFAFDDQDSPRHPRPILRAPHIEPDADVNIPAAAVAVIVVEELERAPYRLPARARTTDPDVIGALAPPWRPFVFDDQDNPRRQRPLYRARRGDPDADAVPLLVVAAVVALDDPQGPRRVLWRGRTTAPDLAQYQPAWTKFAYDEPPGPRREVIRSRTVDPDLVGRPLLPRFAFLDETVQFPHRVIMRSRQGDPDPILMPITVIQPGVFIEDSGVLSRRIPPIVRTLRDVDITLGFWFPTLVSPSFGVVWSIANRGKAGAVATASIAPSQDAVFQTRLRSMYFGLSGPAIGSATAVVRDGQPGIGAIIFQADLYTAANNRDVVSLPEVDLRATAGNVLTVEFLAGTPSDFQEVSAQGDLILLGTPYGD